MQTRTVQNNDHTQIMHKIHFQDFFKYFAFNLFEEA